MRGRTVAVALGLLLSFEAWSQTEYVETVATSYRIWQPETRVFTNTSEFKFSLFGESVPGSVSIHTGPVDGFVDWNTFLTEFSYAARHQLASTPTGQTALFIFNEFSAGTEALAHFLNHNPEIAAGRI